MVRLPFSAAAVSTIVIARARSTTVVGSVLRGPLVSARRAGPALAQPHQGRADPVGEASNGLGGAAAEALVEVVAQQRQEFQF